VSVVANVAINVDSSGAVSKLRQVQQGAQATSQAVDKLNATTAATSNKFKIAANGIKYFTDAAGRTRAENGRFLTSAERAAAGIRNQGNAAQQAAGKLNGLRGAAVGLGSAFGGIAAVLGLIQAGRFVFAKTAEVQSQSRSLAILAGSAEKAGQIIKELQDLGAVTPFTSTELIDSAKRLQAFGVEADKVVETTRRLADASGATGAELSGLVTAYGQVQAKGRLQGEELLQFQERGIALQEELRKMYGMTGEEFQKALSKGQVSAKAVEVALANLTSTGGKYANGAIAQSDTLNGRLSTLQDNVDGVAREVGKVLTPALIEILQQLNTSLSQTPAFVEDIALAFQYAAEQIAPFLNGLSQMQWFFTNLTPPGWAMQMIGGASERGKSTIRGAASRQRQSRENSFIGPAAPQMQGPAIPERLRQKPNNLPPPLMIPSATGTGTGKGAKKGSDDAKRAAEQMQQQLKAARRY
jgi:tape measure domain-containing protein